MNRTDLQLVDGFKGGCIESYEILVDRHKPFVFNVCHQILKNREDVEEVINDTMMAVYNKIHTYNGDSTFSSWLYRVARNFAFMKRRWYTHGHRNAVPTENLPDIAFNDSNLSLYNMKLKSILTELILNLPVPCRDVIILIVVDQLDQREVAKQLKTTIPAVKGRLYLGKSILQKQLLAHVG